MFKVTILTFLMAERNKKQLKMLIKYTDPKYAELLS